MFSFFVYVYLDPTKPGTFTYGNISFSYEPIYIGKGRDRRHLCRRNEALRGLGGALGRRIRAVSPLILKYQEFLLEKEAFSLETTLIRLIGRLICGTGPLFNISDGGDGWSLSAEAKRKISEKAKISQRIRYSNPEEREKMSRAGKAYFSKPGAKERSAEATRLSHSDPTLRQRLRDLALSRFSDPAFIEKHSAALKGRVFSTAARKNMSIARTILWEKRRISGWTFSSQAKENMRLAACRRFKIKEQANV